MNLTFEGVLFDHQYGLIKTEPMEVKGQSQILSEIIIISWMYILHVFIYVFTYIYRSK